MNSDSGNNSRAGSVSGQRASFVTPTTKINARPRTGLTSNLQNVGGRLLVRKEMTEHKQRMRLVKPVINLTPPWGHEDLRKRPVSAAARRGRPPSAQSASWSSQHNDSSHNAAGDASAHQQRPGSALGPATRGATPAAGQQPAEFDVSTLTEEDQDAYQGMLRLLCRVDNGDARRVLEQLYRESEDRKLLAAYTGVFPKLETERKE
jgi:hypothetical protein